MSAGFTPGQFLNQGQVCDLNARHGWFEYGDAQGDVSRAFAQDAISMHERSRAAAPELLAALKELVEMCDQCDSWPSFPDAPVKKAYAAIAKATGETP